MKGDIATVTAIQKKLAVLNDVMFVETNPTPAKFALSLMGKIKPDLRLPLVQPTEGSQAKIKAALQELGII